MIKKSNDIKANNKAMPSIWIWLSWNLAPSFIFFFEIIFFQTGFCCSLPFVFVALRFAMRTKIVHSWNHRAVCFFGWRVRVKYLFFTEQFCELNWYLSGNWTNLACIFETSICSNDRTKNAPDSTVIWLVRWKKWLTVCKWSKTVNRPNSMCAPIVCVCSAYKKMKLCTASENVALFNCQRG